MMDRWDEVQVIYPQAKIVEKRGPYGKKEYAVADADGKLLSGYFHSGNRAVWSIIEDVRRKLQGREIAKPCPQCGQIGFHKIDCSAPRKERGLAPTFDLPTYPGRG
jgi:hypothetical protein